MTLRAAVRVLRQATMGGQLAAVLPGKPATIKQACRSWRSLAFVWLALTLAVPLWAQRDQDGAQLKVELERIGQEMAELQSALAKTEGELGRLLEQLRKLDTEIGVLGQRIRATDSEIAAHRAHMRELETDRAAGDRRLAAHAKALRTQLRAAYAMGRQRRLKLLLNQEDINRAGRVLAYYRYFSDAQRRDIEAMRTELHQMDELLSTWHTAETALQHARERMAARQLEKERQQQDRLAVVNRIGAQANTQRQQLSALSEDRVRLERLVGALQDVFADIPGELGTGPFSGRLGQMEWPVAGKLTLAPGHAKPGGMNREGALIESPIGAEVRAVSYGRVAFADWLRGFGLLLILDHGEGYMSLYGFNDALFAETGDWVVAGQVIAAVGSSGGRATPELYFELRKDGRPIDPRRWFARSAP